MVTYCPREICHVPSPSALLHHSEGAEAQVKKIKEVDQHSIVLSH